MKPDGAYVFSGTITPASALDLSDRIAGGLKRLTITSEGGDIGSALTLAEEIRKAKITVVADKYCLSACAAYILPASPNPSMTAGTLLGFHQTASVGYYIGGVYSREMSELYQSNAQRERTLYEHLKIDRRLLIAPELDLRVRCVGAVKGSNGRWADVFAFSDLGLWFPTISALGSFNYHVRGNSLHTRGDVLAAASQQLRGHRLNFSVGDGQQVVSSEATLIAKLRAMPRCPAALNDSPEAQRAYAHAKAIHNVAGQ